MTLSLPLTSGPHGDAVPLMNATETLPTDVSERIVSKCFALRCFLKHFRSALFSRSPNVNVERYRKAPDDLAIEL